MKNYPPSPKRGVTLLTDPLGKTVEETGDSLPLPNPNTKIIIKMDLNIRKMTNHPNSDVRKACIRTLAAMFRTVMFVKPVLGHLQQCSEQ